MSQNRSLLQSYAAKIHTVHPALLLGPLAIASWMVAPGFAPGDAGQAPGPGPIRAALDGTQPGSGSSTANPAGGAGVAGGYQASAAVPPQVIVMPGGNAPSNSAPGGYADGSMDSGGGGAGGGSSGSGSGSRRANPGRANAGQQPQGQTQQSQTPGRPSMASAPSGPAARPNTAPANYRGANPAVVTPASTPEPGRTPLNIAPHNYAAANPVVMGPVPEPQSVHVPPPLIVIPPFLRPPMIFGRPFVAMPRVAYGHPMIARPAMSGGGGGHHR